MLTGHRGPVQAVAIASDGTWLGSGGADGTVRIWDAASGKLQATWQGHHSAVDTLAVAPNGRLLASGGNDKTVRIWDTAVGDVLTLMRTEAPIRACAWTGTTGLAAAGPGGLYVFDYKT